MKRRPQYLPPRQSVVIGYTRRMLDETAMNANTFAMAVAERYLETVAPDVRQVPFRLGEGDALFKAIKDNAQTLRRYMDGTVKVLPADLEDAWVLSLPEPYRSECERDLARRRGRYSFELPGDIASEDFATIGEVMQQSGELFSEWGKSVADGHLTPAELQRVEKETDDVIAALLRLRTYARDRAKQKQDSG
jgi:hypothetical protein